MTIFAITFAGQGSQSPGMMAGLAAMPVVQKTFEEASDLIKVDLWSMVVNGPVELQNQTVNTQIIQSKIQNLKSEIKMYGRV